MVKVERYGGGGMPNSSAESIKTGVQQVNGVVGQTNECRSDPTLSPLNHATITIYDQNNSAQ